ncbi:MAG TPA: metal ABC transporter permease [Calditerricola sp.]
MLRGLVAAVLVGIICGVVGCFIILRGLALMGDALSHAVLPGVAIAFMLGINFFIGAVVTGILTALAIGFVTQNSRVKADSAIGIMFTAAFALGIILITQIHSVSVDLPHILFGDVLGVSTADLWLTGGTGFVVLLAVILFYKELLLTSFDPTMATAIGLPNRLIHYFLMVLLSLVTVASLQTVGIVLVVAMLITPGATAYLLTDRLSVMLWLAAFFGVVSTVAGLYVSYYVENIPSGATIVVTATSLFLLALLFSPKQGLVWRRLRKARRTAASKPAA